MTNQNSFFFSTLDDVNYGEVLELGIVLKTVRIK